MDDKKRRLVLTVMLGSLVLGAGGYYWLSGNNSANAANESVVRAIRAKDNRKLDKSPTVQARPSKIDSRHTAERRTRGTRNDEKRDRPTRGDRTRGTAKPKKILPYG